MNYKTDDDSPLHMPPEQGCVARSLPPAQYLPPFFGAGLLQSRRRYWMQSALHDDHDDHEDQRPSTEGQTALQPFFWTGAPSHAGPPFTGAGLSHSRVRLRTPRPHLALQGDQSDHSPHCPGTARRVDFESTETLSEKREHRQGQSQPWSLRQTRIGQSRSR